MSKPKVVIVRKDKRVNHKITHLVAFAATGGASGVYTAAKVGSNAGYNARTARLQAEPTKRASLFSRKPKIQPLDTADLAANFRAVHVPSSSEYKAIHSR